MASPPRRLSSEYPQEAQRENLRQQQGEGNPLVRSLGSSAYKTPSMIRTERVCIIGRGMGSVTFESKYLVSFAARHPVRSLLLV